MAPEAEFELGAIAIAEALKGRTIGSTTVEDARGLVDIDSEEATAIFLQLFLSEPEGETWPLEDNMALRAAVLDAIAQLELPPVSVYVRLIPLTPEPLDEDGRLFA